MRIVQALGSYFPESLGGTEFYVSALSHRLRSAGHELFIAAPEPGADKERTYYHDGFAVYHYPIPSSPTRDECQGSILVRGAEQFHEWLAQIRPDVVHFHTFVTGLGVHELRVVKSLDARIIVTTHSSSLGFICQRGTMMRWGERLCDGICEPRKCAACELQRKGLPKSVATIASAIPPGVSRMVRPMPGRFATALNMRDLIVRNQMNQRELLALVDKFVLLTQWAFEAVAANGAPREKLALNRLGLSWDRAKRKPGPDERPTKAPILVGYLGRLDRIKGVHDLAKAVASLPRHVPIRVEIRGPIRNEAEREVENQLKAIVAEDPRVTFAVSVSQAEAPQILGEYDVLCCPSVCLEGGPTVAIEAHAVGTPVIGTRIGGLAEIVSDSVNGRLVPAGDWKALAQVLREIAVNPTNTIDRWRSALPCVRTMDEVAHDYLALYDS